MEEALMGWPVERLKPPVYGYHPLRLGHGPAGGNAPTAPVPSRDRPRSSRTPTRDGYADRPAGPPRNPPARGRRALQLRRGGGPEGGGRALGYTLHGRIDRSILQDETDPPFQLLAMIALQTGQHG